MDRVEKIQQVIVTAQQMREIEGRVFAAGMPVAALMEKVASLIVRRISREWGSGGVGEWGNGILQIFPLFPVSCSLFPVSCSLVKNYG